MKTIFKEGMKVWDDVAFPGTLGFVTTTDKDSDYSMGVNFKGTILDYTPEGRIDKTLQPTLSIVPYEFKLPEQIMPYDFKKYDRILVRDNQDEKWYPMLFNYKSMSMYVTTNNSIFTHCIPYDEEILKQQGDL